MNLTEYLVRKNPEDSNLEFTRIEKLFRILSYSKSLIKSDRFLPAASNEIENFFAIDSDWLGYTFRNIQIPF